MHRQSRVRCCLHAQVQAARSDAARCMARAGRRSPPMGFSRSVGAAGSRWQAGPAYQWALPATDERQRPARRTRARRTSRSCRPPAGNRRGRAGRRDHASRTCADRPDRAGMGGWGEQRDSNPWHPGPQPGALPAELCPPWRGRALGPPAEASQLARAGMREARVLAAVRGRGCAYAGSRGKGITHGPRRRRGDPIGGPVWFVWQASRCTTKAQRHKGSLNFVPSCLCGGSTCLLAAPGVEAFPASAMQSLFPHCPHQRRPAVQDRHDLVLLRCR